MSKKDQPSRYLASFYSNPNEQPAPGTSGNSNATSFVSSIKKPQGGNSTIQNTNSVGNRKVPTFYNSEGIANPGSSLNVPTTIPSGTGNRINQNRPPEVTKLFHSGQKRPPVSVDSDKFKKPGDFFKSSQSTSSQITSSQNRGGIAKRSSFGGGGSTHEMLSQSFQVKKPHMGNNGGPQKFCAKFPLAQRTSHIMGRDVASTNALQLQWTQKMCQRKESLDNRNLTGNKGKSPLGKSFWADSSFSKPKEACKNQQNDPWYSNDVWGDDLPEEAVNACLQFASQKAQNPQNNDPLSSWMDETWASPTKSSQQSEHLARPSTSAKSLFSDGKCQLGQSAEVKNLKDLLAGDDDFLALLDTVEQPKPSVNASKYSFSLSGKVSFPQQAARPSLPTLSQDRKIPLSQRIPVGGQKSSFVIKAKEYESPSQETLTQSQRTFRKPVKSLPSPSTTKMSFTTEWLRGQLEKISSEYTVLKENVQVKEGESKLLREKLKSAQEEVRQHKLDKARDLEKLRLDYEARMKNLEKQLEATQTQAMFKAKEAESSLEKYRELKNISVMNPEPPKSLTFKNIPSIGPKPEGATKVDILADETIVDKIEATISSEFINDTIFQTPKKSDNSLVAGTPERSMFDDSPTKSEIAHLPKVPPNTHVLPRQYIFNRNFIRRNEVFREASTQVVHGNQPKRELNQFLMPPIEYLPHMLLQTEFSEQELENYLVRRPTLGELWGVPCDVFGATVLDDYEKMAIGDEIPADPARMILSPSRYFSTLSPIHGGLLSLADSTRWGPREWKMAEDVVDLATNMVRELYATLGDPRLLRTTYTIYDRDPKIRSDFLDFSELTGSFDPVSPLKWKNESFVELRRCLVLIGFLCSVDQMTARYIINPRAYTSKESSMSHDLSRASTQPEDDNFIFKMTVSDGEQKQSELKLKQMYRDLHMKKLTLTADLANAFSSCPLPTPAKVPVGANHENSLAQNALQLALENSPKYSVLRSGGLSNSFKRLETISSVEEFKKCVSGFEWALGNTGVQDVVGKLQGELNPGKIALLKNIREKVVTSDQITSYKVSVPERLFEAVRYDVLRVSSDYGILGAPVNRCITLSEKQIMQLALLNNKLLKNVFDKSVEVSPPRDLDLSWYAADADYEVVRKRKISVENVEPRKTMKMTDYDTPPFDKTLYSQIQKEPKDGVIVIAETHRPFPIVDDQLAKFEKREEMAELKKKMLAEEKMESKRHALAPVRILGRNSPTTEDSANREVAMEIEKMFQTQIRSDVLLDESVWSSESEDEIETITSSSTEDNVVIEVIPELVKHFLNKLKNAGLLELLCEVFKEGGVLRFTHCLNGVMLGTVIMLQNIVKYQRKEVEPCLSKLATIIREILYTRPSPRVVLEVNILLRYAVDLPGFPRMLCHNASPETFVTSNELVYFTRGACLLEVVCILVTYATEEDTDYTVYLEMIHWVYYIVCTERKHVASLYEQHNNNRRRCMCITALNNTIVMITHRTLSLYSKLTDTFMKSLLERHLEKIFIPTLQVLRLAYSYGPLSFLLTIRTQYLEYRQLLTWFRDLHKTCNLFHLPPAYCHVVSEMLNDTRDPNNFNQPPEHKSHPHLGLYFSPGKSWPYDLHNPEIFTKN